MTSAKGLILKREQRLSDVKRGKTKSALQWDRAETTAVRELESSVALAYLSGEISQTELSRLLGVSRDKIRGMVTRS